MTDNIRISEIKISDDINLIVGLANQIWKEHYSPLIGVDQVDYMLKTFHSYEAIARELEKDGGHYYTIHYDEDLVGYIGVRIDATQLFLSKLYVLSTARGKGIGKMAIGFLKNLAKLKSNSCIRLTVNKKNVNSIAAYKKIGFKVTDEICTDIGQGYYMDDFKMELNLY